MVKSYVPDRGDVVWLDFNPQKGHEQAGLRPALVLSPIYYNRAIKLMLVCPISSKVKGYPFEVRIKTKKIDGAVLADQVKSLDWLIRKVSFAEKAPHEVVQQACDLVETLIRD